MIQTQFEVPVDSIPESPVPDLIDTFAGRMHLTAMGCKGGLNCKQHIVSMPEIRRTLVDFMGKLLDAFETAHYGDPLPEEERRWIEETTDATP